LKDGIDPYKQTIARAQKTPEPPSFNRDSN